jgi:hypothetical protein
MKLYHPRSVVIKVLYIGPRVRPILAETLPEKIIQMRVSAPYLSSTEPATTILGIAHNRSNKSTDYDFRYVRNGSNDNAERAVEKRR